jgi:hypothetical protein
MTLTLRLVILTLLIGPYLFADATAAMLKYFMDQLEDGI